MREDNIPFTSSLDLRRSWGYQELAMRYFPHVKPGSASNQLRRWILHSKALQSRLSECDWVPGNKIFTPRQVRCIVEHLGEP